jgi:hypothetical protein
MRWTSQAESAVTSTSVAVAPAATEPSRLAKSVAQALKSGA